MNDIKPKLAIVIPEKNNVQITLVCLFSIINQCKYPTNRFTIYLADTGSEEKQLKILKSYCKNLCEDNDLDIRFIEYDYYNFAKINNDVINKHIDNDTELVLLMNNDIELVSDAISESVNEYLEYKEEIGTIGVRLMYPNLSIQHLGIKVFNPHIEGFKTAFSHYHLKERYTKDIQKIEKKETFGNTGAFLLTPFKLWKEIGGLNENYKVCFEDVEYNLECLLKGKKNITLYKPCCYHRESYTKKQEINKQDIMRIQSYCEKNNITERFRFI